MAVYIRGMSIPEEGYVDVRLFSDGRATTQTGEHPFYREMKITAVKEPHGRLIDADALKQTLIPMWNCNSDSDFANKCVWHALEDAPTVIERSEDDKK